jgi:hypothetical protein
MRRRCLIGHLESRTVLRARLAVIVDAGGGDVGVPEPLLDLGNVGPVVERIGGRGRPQRMGTDFEAEHLGIFLHYPVTKLLPLRSNETALIALGAVGQT